MLALEDEGEAEHHADTVDHGEEEFGFGTDAHREVGEVDDLGVGFEDRDGDVELGGEEGHCSDESDCDGFGGGVAEVERVEGGEVVDEVDGFDVV